MAKPSLTGKPLVQSATRLLLQDKSMILLLAAGGVAEAFAFALVLVPASILHGSLITDNDGLPGMATYALAVLLSTFVSTLFMGAVVASAMMRADGGDPTVATAMAVAWSRRGPLLSWAAMSTVVGVVMRTLERFGVAGLLVRLVAGVAWSVATMFAVPVIIVEGAAPVEAVRRSAAILTERFGSNVRATFRLGVVWNTAAFGSVILGAVGYFVGESGRQSGALSQEIVGALMLGIGVVGFFVVTAIYAALSVYLRTVLYRYASDLPTPGIDTRTLPYLYGTSG